MTPRLGIDFGTTHTVAYLEGNDGRAQPLLFDSSPLLSSAVFADPSGRLLTGRDGDRSARLDPTRYEPNPKRRIDEAIILLGNDEFPVATVFSAVLSRVVAEANRNTGGVPLQAVLTHPANWGSHRKDVLVNAAAAAGLTSVTVVPEPVAAAAHFTQVLGRTVNPGEALAVYDFGAGTFDASLVRLRSPGGPDGTWELVASEGLGDIGGLDLDAVLVDQIGRVVAQRDPQRWHQLVNPSDTLGRRASKTFWDDVRAAKEQLSRTPTAAVHVPLFDTDTHLTRDEFEAAARPLLDRTIGLMANLVGRAGGTRLAGLYLVGGSSRIPLIATLLHQRLGVAPTLIDTPELLVAQGSLRAVPPKSQSPGFAPAPPTPGQGFAPAGPAGPAGPGGPSGPGGFAQPAAGYAPPAAGGFAAPAAGGYGSPAGYASPAPGGYAPATPPGGYTQATPSGGFGPTTPVSTPPGGQVSTPPGAPISAPTLGIPTSAVPASGGPAGPTSGAPDPGGLPPVPAGMPLWGNASTTQPGHYSQAAPGLPDATRRPANARRSSPLKWIVAAAAALVLLGGGGAAAAVMLSGDDKNAGRNSADGNTGTGQKGESNAIAPDSGAKLGDGGAAQSGTFTVGRTVWYLGTKVTVKTVSYDPAVTDKPLSMDITIENLGTEGLNNVRSIESYFSYDGAITKGSIEEIQSLPGKETSNGTFVFKPQKPVTDLRKGTLSVGGDDEVQAKIPFGDLASAVTLEPKKVAGPVAEQRSGVLGMKLNQCEQRSDNPVEHDQAKKGYMMVVCDVDVKSYKQSIYDHGVWKGNFRLKLPDGTTTSPEKLDTALLNQNDLVQGLPFNFVIRAPAPGAYVLQFYDAGRLGNEPVTADRPLVEVPMTLT